MQQRHDASAALTIQIILDEHIVRTVRIYSNSSDAATYPALLTVNTRLIMAKEFTLYKLYSISKVFSIKSVSQSFGCHSFSQHIKSSVKHGPPFVTFEPL